MSYSFSSFSSWRAAGRRRRRSEARKRSFSRVDAIGEVRSSPASPIINLAAQVRKGPNTDSRAAAGRCYSITWSSHQYGGGHRSNVEGSASGSPQCSWDNSPRPGTDEKLSLLPAKVVEVDSGSRLWSIGCCLAMLVMNIGTGRRSPGPGQQ